jgi:hypothetical protein
MRDMAVIQQSAPVLPAIIAGGGERAAWGFARWTILQIFG